ncbi:unnamed protein product [Coffea canephora]|uniref:Uncharacterized protein n=1 Tax=Coffea canephora TaxID=49390 RepID=A0A068V476_COFCA|nr:unnamed protein product [Coffea canephora]
MKQYIGMATCHVIFLFFSAQLAIVYSTHPTDGFVELPFNTSCYHIQKPYDLPVDQRYRFLGGAHKLWVYSTDNPLSRNSPRMPRTEIMTQVNPLFSCTFFFFNTKNLKTEQKGEIFFWQFEGYGFVPNGTSGVCIMQVFGASPPHASALMLRVYNGSLTCYRANVLVPNI